MEKEYIEPIYHTIHNNMRSAISEFTGAVGISHNELIRQVKDNPEWEIKATYVSLLKNVKCFHRCNLHDVKMLCELMGVDFMSMFKEVE